MKCPFCKSEINDNSRFCPNCGKNLPHNRQNTDNNQQDSGFSGTAENSGNQSVTAEKPQINQDLVYSDRFSQGDAQFSQNSYQFSQNNTDPQLNEALKGINTMNVMQIICLISMFLPFVNILSQILLLVIIIMSFGLTSKVSNAFRKFNYEQYARISDGIKTKCAVILVSSVLSIVAVFVASAGIGAESTAVTVSGILIAVVASLTSAVLQIYCFCRLYTVKNALESISLNQELPQKPSSGTVIWVCVIAVIFFLMIVIGGILAAIALPAYASYMKRARFTEVTTIVDAVKRQAELCAFEFDYTNLEGNCDNTRQAAEGSGWALYSPHDYATKYVESIEVVSLNAERARSGKPEIHITATTTRSGFGGRKSGISVVGKVVNKDIDWSVDYSNSPCKTDKLC